MAQKPMPSGGQRKGAGRPKSDPTTVATFRVKTAILEQAKKNHGEGFSKKVVDFIARLAKTKQKTGVK